MIFTGNSYKLIPNVKNLSFGFNNINLQGTGVAEIGISGSGIIKFRFANNRIYNESGLFIGVYDEGSNTNISGNLKTGNYSFYIDDDLIYSRSPRSRYNYSKLFINVTGATLNCDIFMNSNDVPVTVVVPPKFYTLSNLTGYIRNDSVDNPFYVYDVSLQSLQSNDPFFSGAFSGIVNSGTGINFILNDASVSRFDETLNFLLIFNTSLGQISGLQTTERLSGLESVTTTLINNDGDTLAYMLFDGSGVPINSFTYINNPVSKVLTYEIFSTDLMGRSKDSSVSVSFEAISPTGGGYYGANYVTGFSLVTSGEYLYPPTAIFTGYYSVTGLNYDLNSILLDSGCSGPIPVIFSGSNGYGAGASGNLSVTKLYLQDAYNAGVHYYYIPTQFTLVTGGTGYLSPSRAILLTGIYSNCKDVAESFGYDYLIYKPFVAYGHMDVSAGYLTGVVLTVTGLVNGGTQTGYLVTGLDITNLGFGYNINSFPKMSFSRRAGDSLTKNASGVLSIKQSGLYDFTSHWSLNTGASNTALSNMPIPSGLAMINSNANYFTVQVNYSGKDHTQPLVAKLTVSTSDGQSVYSLISGARSYSTETGFLKKKDILELIKISPASELTFLLSQDDLDRYYSSTAYLGNEFTIDLGDLDF